MNTQSQVQGSENEKLEVSKSISSLKSTCSSDGVRPEMINQMRDKPKSVGAINMRRC